MDTYEATKTVMSRIQTLDPENASKIMGYILIQDQGDKEMIRLAFSPDALLLSYINQAKARLGLTSNTPSPNPFSHPISPNGHFRQNPPRIMIPNNHGFHLSNPSSPMAAAFQRTRPRPISFASVPDNSYFATNNSPNNGLDSPSPHFYGNNNGFGDNPVVDPIMSPGGRSDSLVFPYGEDGNGVSSRHPHPFHKRSYSVNDAAFLSNLEEGGDGFMWRPCMYFSRGLCKDGVDCEFLHGDVGGVDPVDVVSPSKAVSGFDELLKMKALQQRRFALMASGGRHPFAYNKCMDSLTENLSGTVYSCRDRSDLSPLRFGASASSSAHQIYLTFPADSTFKEEDVSSYFSMFGPVQDVRIPYQQKRMFGFVTFVYPETVKLILAKGNPHFVCDSRVLVKPYKEKGKFKERKQQSQQCLSPSGVDSGEHFDTPFGPRMLLSPREMMLRRKLEQEAEMQYSIELQGRRMMNLQLMDMENANHNYHYPSSFPTGIPYSSRRQSKFLINQHLTPSSDSIEQENSEEADGGQESVADEKNVLEGSECLADINTDGGKKLNRGNGDDSDLHESLKHILPDNLFASPTKLAAENHCVFSQSLPAEANDSVQTSSSSNDPLLPGSSPLTVASLKSCYLQMPRFSSGQEAIEM
ncbi:hypothetical protein OROHE_005132 [Orobanche hederae]